MHGAPGTAPPLPGRAEGGDTRFSDPYLKLLQNSAIRAQPSASFSTLVA